LKNKNNFLKTIVQYARTFGKWMVLGGIIGICCGFAGAAFVLSLRRVTALRLAHPWLLWLLPAAGLAITAIYKLTGSEGKNVNDLIDGVHQGKRVTFWLFPSVFAGTVLTHLCGGSAGREGAALQMGGTIGGQIGKLWRVDAPDLRVCIIAGMAAFFSALFGTPLTAVLFVSAIVGVDTYYHAAYLPTVTAALMAYWIAGNLGVVPTHFHLTAPVTEPVMMLRVGALALACALVSVLFCGVMHGTQSLMEKWIANPWLRVMAGGGAVIALTLLCRSRDYNGAGMEIIAAAIQQGRVHPMAFLLKIIFTAVTLGAGYKGGEVVPAFFVGATFGCFAGPLLGIPAGFAAALGLVCVFCGVTNSPIPSVVLAAELFDASGILYFALACGIANFFSGYGGLYSSQHIFHSKLKLSCRAYEKKGKKGLIQTYRI
jgi:H+/Cl- antiporter ClcA